MHPDYIGSDCTIHNKTLNMSEDLASLICCDQPEVWQYRMLSFQPGYTKLKRFLPKNQHTPRKLLNFENWCNGEVSKIEHHLRK